MKKGNRIYHYCKLTTAIEKILPQTKLLFNFIKNTNDPREYKNFVFAARYFPNDNINFTENNKRVSELLREDAKVLCFSLDHEHFWGNSYARMWAHYGDNHKGLCLELDKAEFINENKDKINPDLFREITYYEFNIEERITHKIVDYTKIANGDFESYIKNRFRNENLEYIYFTKNKEWDSERELRLIYFSNKNENEFCSIKNSLKKIHLGVDFNDGYLPAIKELSKGIGLFRMEYLDVGLVSKQI